MDIPMGHMGSVLVVDNCLSNLQVLGELLEEGGYQARPAVSGEIALRLIDVDLPDLILLNVRLPGIDGYETCRRLYAKQRSRDIPVIFIGATNDLDGIRKVYGAGGVDFVPQPFQPDEVLALVRSHLLLKRWSNKA